MERNTGDARSQQTPAPGLAQVPQPEEGLLETSISIITEPVPTLRRLVQRRPVGWALLVASIVGLASGLAQATQFNPADMSAVFPGLDFAAWRTWMLVSTAVLGVPLAIMVTVVFTGIFHIMGLILGGRGPYSGLFVGMTFAWWVPQAVSVPLSILPLVLGTAGKGLSTLASLGILVWALALTTIAIRENYRFPTARAIAALLIPIGALLLVSFVLAIIGVILLFAVMGGPPSGRGT